MADQTTDPHPPYRAYPAITTVFVGGIAGAGVLAVETRDLRAAGGLNDWLQAGFVASGRRQNELEHRPS